MLRKMLVAVVVAPLVLFAAAMSYRQFVLVDSLRDVVRAELNDPDSATFRNERYVGDWTLERGALCGEVNARNAMGGYVGYRPFEAARSMAIIESDVERRIGIKMCDFDESGMPWWWLRW